jgi:integrase
MDGEGTQATVKPQAGKSKGTRQSPTAKRRGLVFRPDRKGRGEDENGRRGNWWVSWCCTEGHRHRQCIGPYGLALQEHGARRKEVEKAQRLGLPYCPDVDRRKRLEDRKQRVPFKEIAQDFLDYAKVNKRDQNDGQRMTRLLATFGDRLAAEITPKDVEDYKAKLAERLAPATVNRDLSLLKATFNRALRAGKAESNPVKAVKLFKENNARTRCLSDEEEARLSEALPVYLKPFLAVALNTGMRWGELARLTWEDADFYTGTLHVRESKSGEGRRIPMNRVVREKLQAVRREQVQKARDHKDGEREILSPLVFCAPQGGFLRNFGRDWFPALRKAEIPDFRWHDTRHTAASRLVMAGVDLYTVKEILGHKTITMTQRYAHLSPGHQRQALERLADRRACSPDSQVTCDRESRTSAPSKVPNAGEQVALLVAPGKQAEKGESRNYQ